MNIFQKAITPDMPRVLEGEQIYVYVPQATSTNAGIASYKNADFKVNDGTVLLRWPIQSIVQGPLANPSLIKVQDTEFEYTNANTDLEYEGSIITSTVSEIQIKRDLRDAYNRPDLVMLDPSYFPRVIVEKDGKQYYKYNTTAVHYNISQKLSDNEQAQARLNIGAGSLAVVQQSNKNSNDALLKAISAEQTSVEALELVKTSDAAAKEAVVKATKAVTDASQAIANADAALTKSSDAFNMSNTALDTSNNAMSSANNALANANIALSTANSAKSESSQAIITAESAEEIAETAEQIAQNALNLVTEGVGSQVLVNGAVVQTFNADTKADVTYVNQKIDDIMGPGSTEAIDTILELAAAFKNNSDVIKLLNEAVSTKANASDVTDMLATKANASDLANYLSLTGGTMTGVLYTEAATPYFIGKNKKVGMRAVDENNTVVGQFFVSDTSKEQYNGYYSGFVAQGNDGKNYAMRISANGPVYRYDSVDHPIALKEDIPDVSNHLTKSAGVNQKLTGPLYVSTSGSLSWSRTNGIVLGSDDTSASTIDSGGGFLKLNGLSGLAIGVNNDTKLYVRSGYLEPAVDNAYQLGSSTRNLSSVYAYKFYAGGREVATKNDIPDTSNLASKSEIPTTYIKNAAIASDGSKLTLTKQDGSTVEFEGGGNVDLTGYATVEVFDSEEAALAASQADPNKICLY